MWQSLSRSTKAALFKSQSVAQRLRVKQISPEVLIVAIFECVLGSDSQGAAELFSELRKLVVDLESEIERDNEPSAPDHLLGITLSKTSMQDVRQAFQSMQVDGTGEVTVTQLLDACMKHLNSVPILTAIQAILEPLQHSLLKLEETASLQAGFAPSLLSKFLSTECRSVTQKLTRAVVRADSEAERAQVGEVTPSLLLLAILEDSKSCATRLLESLGCDSNLVAELVNSRMEDGAKLTDRRHPLPKATFELVRSAKEFAKLQPMGTQHILLALVSQESGDLAKLLGDLGVSATGIKSLMQDPAFNESSLEKHEIKSRRRITALEFLDHDDLMACKLLLEHVNSKNPRLGNLSISASDLDRAIRTESSWQARERQRSDIPSTLEILQAAHNSAVQSGQQLHLGHILHAYFNVPDSRTRNALLDYGFDAATFLDDFGNP